VQHAHQKGIVHRDLKPGNILVVPEDDASSSATGSRADSKALQRDLAHVGQPKVLDFGLARITDADVHAVTIQTEAGQILGTVRYMSPEQVEGVPEDIDTRSDIYALGVVAYELLSGRAPHDVDGRTVYDAMRVIKEEDPQRLSSIDRSLHGDVETIVAKALEKEKQRRYASAGDMAADIRRFLRDEPIVARPASTFYQIRKFAARNRVLVGGVAATFLALVAGIIATTRQSISATRARDEANLSRDEATKSRDEATKSRDEATKSRDEAQRAAAEAQAMNDFFVKDMLLGSDPQHAKGKRITIEDVLQNAASKVDEALGSQPLAAASVRQTLGRVFYSLGRNDDAEAHQRFAYDTFRRLRGDAARETLEAGHDLARTQLARHRLEEAESLLRSELAYRRSTNDLSAVQPMTPLAQVLQKKGDTAGAEELYTKVIEILRSRDTLSESESSSLMSASTDLADILAERGETDRAFELYDESLGILKRQYGELHPDIARVLGNRANLLDMVGRAKEAAEGYKKALAVQRAVFRADHPDIAVTLLSLALVSKHLGDYAQAESYARQGLELDRKLFGDEAPETARALSDLGLVLRALDKNEEAETSLRTAIAVYTKTVGADDEGVGDAQFELALVLRARKDIDGALAACEESLRIRRIHAKSTPGTLIGSQSLLAQLHHSKHEYALAEPAYRDVLESYRKLEGDGTLNVAVAYANLGMVLEDQRKLPEAEAELAHAVEIARKALDPADPTLGFLMARFAHVKKERGNLDEAAALLEEALAIETRKLPPGHSGIASASALLGEVRLAQGRAAEAEPLLRDALESRRKMYPEGDLTRAETQSALGRCLVALQRYEEAEPLLTGAYPVLVEKKSDPALARDAAHALVDLYGATNATEKAAGWKARAEGNGP
jgi:tetratricopeptide (TPR) repeat protein